VYANLISVAELAPLVEAGTVAVFDCRDDLMRPGWGREAYLEGHVPGAVYVDLGKDLSGPPITDQGRHPMPSEDALVALFSRLGIAPGMQVVAYDQRDGSIAARMWWLLRYLRHDAVAVLAGGYPAWQRAGLGVAEGDERRQAASFRGEAQRERLAVMDDLPSAARIVDARHAARYRGESEPIDPVAGHIPGARNLPFMENLDEDGQFLTREQVRANFQQALEGTPAAQAVYSCGSGVTACHLVLAAHWAGLPEGRVYVGSFSEWTRDASRPVATGRDPGHF